MNVVFDAADDDGLAIEVDQNSAEITMQFVAESLVAQKGSAFFCREHCVNQNFCDWT